MKIKLSKNQWESIGKVAGWIKSAQVNLDALYEQHQMGKAKPVWVSVYSVSRNYGGPEEGGWWYDNFQLESSKEFFDHEKAQAFADALNEQMNEAGANDEDLSSSRGFDQYPDPSGGDPAYDHSDADIPVGFSGLSRNHMAVVEETQGEMTTRERPHYE